MKKKAFSLLLALVMALSVLPVGALAAEGGTEPTTPTEPAKYTIKFAAGDGTGSMADVNVDKVENAAAEYELPACGFTAPDDKEFDKWTTSVGTIEGSTLTIPAATDTAAEIILTATWKDLPTYTIVLDPNGGVGKAITLSRLAEGVDGNNYMVLVPVLEATFAPPTGKEADTWVVDESAPEGVTIDTRLLTIPKSVATTTEIHLKATWKEASTTVTVGFQLSNATITLLSPSNVTAGENGLYTIARNTELKFKVTASEGKVVPFVGTLDGTTLTPDSEGVYSYTVTGDTTFQVVARQGGTDLSGLPRRWHHL